MKNTPAKQKAKTSPPQQEEQGMDMDLHQLFLDELADLFHAEKQLTKALPKMAKAANSEELAEAFRSHLAETEIHVRRLTQVFASVDAPAKAKTCEAMKGLLEEGAEIMRDLKNSSALDDGLIAAAQKVEHYEIASYGTVRAWAKKMGHTEAVKLLQATLDEEGAADKKLTAIAEGSANNTPAPRPAARGAARKN